MDSPSTHKQMICGNRKMARITMMKLIDIARKNYGWDSNQHSGILNEPCWIILSWSSIQSSPQQGSLPSRKFIHLPTNISQQSARGVDRWHDPSCDSESGRILISPVPLAWRTAAGKAACSVSRSDPMAMSTLLMASLTPPTVVASSVSFHINSGLIHHASWERLGSCLTPSIRVARK